MSECRLYHCWLCSTIWFYSLLRLVHNIVYEWEGRASLRKEPWTTLRMYDSSCASNFCWDLYFSYYYVYIEYIYISHIVIACDRNLILQTEYLTRCRPEPERWTIQRVNSSICSNDPSAVWLWESSQISDEFINTSIHFLSNSIQNKTKKTGSKYWHMKYWTSRLYRSIILKWI